MEVFLKGHAGDRLRVDRRTRQEFIKAPALTMGLAVQPSVLEDIGKNRGFDGRGLLARFLYCLPEFLVGYRKIDSDPVPPAVGATYERNVFPSCSSSRTGPTPSWSRWGPKPMPPSRRTASAWSRSSAPRAGVSGTSGSGPGSSWVLRPASPVCSTSPSTSTAVPTPRSEGCIDGHEELNNRKIEATMGWIEGS
jgi:hypothetical protein